MISGFLGPVGTLVSGFEYTKFILTDLKNKPGNILEYIIFEIRSLEIRKFPKSGKCGGHENWKLNVGGSQQLTLTIDKDGKSTRWSLNKILEILEHVG